MRDGRDLRTYRGLPGKEAIAMHGLGGRMDPFEMDGEIRQWTSLEGHQKSPVGPVRAGGSQIGRRERQKRSRKEEVNLRFGSDFSNER